MTINHAGHWFYMINMKMYRFNDNKINDPILYHISYI